MTPNWEKNTAEMNDGEGWNWWTFTAKALRENYFFGGFHYLEGTVRGGTDHFRAHNFFVPFIDQVNFIRKVTQDQKIKLSFLIVRYQS